MNRLPALFAAAGLLLTTILPSMAAERQPFSAEDLVRLERVSDPQLSPDGRHLVYSLRQTDMAADRGVMSLWIVDVETTDSAPRRLLPDDVSGHHPRWSTDGEAVLFLSSQSGSAQVWRQPLDGGDPVQVTDLPLDVSAFLVSPTGQALALSVAVFPDCDSLACTRQRLDERAADPTTGRLHTRLFVRHWDRWKDGRRAQLFLAELDGSGQASAEPLPLSRGLDADVPSAPFGSAAEWSFAPDGDSLIFAARIAGNDEPWSTNFDLYRVDLAGGEPENLTADNPAWDSYPRFSPDGRFLVWLAHSRPGFESDRFAIMIRDLATGEQREIAPDWDRSASAVRFSADSERLYTTADHLGRRPLFAIDIASGAVEALEPHGRVAGFSVAGERIVIAREDLKSPTQLYLLGSNGEQTRALTHHNAEKLAGIAFGDYEQFSFPGWEGNTVYGYVVKPVDFQPGRRYPVAFIIHGGPQGSMGEGFHYRWNPQTYAGAGMAAVFIDFHGSTGYGQDFVDSISGDWGGKPLVDLQKGLAHAIERYGFLDGDRVCALGASYGGYMVNWIAGQWPDRFRCLVNHCGLFDNRSMYYSTEELWFVEWEHGGPYFANPAGHERQNPVNYVENWQTPMLVIHGALDFRVPLEQGLSTFTALQRRGIASEFLYFPDENHWVLKPNNSLLWHQHVKRWLDQWLNETP